MGFSLPKEPQELILLYTCLNGKPVQALKHTAMKTARPLLCWDIFMEGFHKRLELASDIQQLIQLSQRQSWQHELDFERQLIWLNKTIVVTDEALRIVYASSNILAMNGYLPQEVIGKRPSLFQGKDTSFETKSYIRSAIEQRIPFETSILNYRKNGESYMCHLQEYPLFNHKKALVNFIAFECLA